VDQVLPNRFDSAGASNFTRAMTTRTFPPSGARYAFSVGGPNGLAKVFALASRRPLDLSTVARFESGADFATSRSGEEAFGRAVRNALGVVPNSEWMAAAALYYVGTRPSVGPYGAVTVDSDERGAGVYVDRVFVGYTPLSYDLRPGTYDVEVVATGRSASERIQIRSDRTVEVFLTLGAPPQPDVPADPGDFLALPPSGLSVGEEVRDTLREGTHAARFVLSGLSPGAVVEVEMNDLSGGQVDTLLYVIDGITGKVLYENDDAPGLDRSFVTFVADQGTSYQVVATSWSGLDVGQYRLSVRQQGGQAAPPQGPRQGTAAFTSTPSGAQVFVDGRMVGVTPTGRITLDEGVYEAEFRRQGYVTARTPFTVSADQTRAVSAALQSQTASLHITGAVRGTNVFVEGTMVATARAGSERIAVDDLAEGTVQVVLVAPGYRTEVHVVAITGGSTATLFVQQKPY